MHDSMAHRVAVAFLALAVAAGCGSSGGTNGNQDAAANGDSAVGQVDGPVQQQDGPATTDGLTCLNACTNGVTQCIGIQLQTCQVQSDGCTDWNTPQDCAGGHACNGGACPTCTDACTYGNTQCVGSQVQRCVAGSSGCNVWDPPENCPGDLACGGGTCPVCADRCTLGVTKCTASQVQTCETQSSGCTDWSAPENCLNGKACTGTSCPTCVDDCTVNATICDGVKEKTCQQQTDGCLHYGTAHDCPNGKPCTGTACPTCIDQCVEDQTKCSGLQVQTCSVQASACTDWDPAVDCPNGGACQNNACVNACTVGEHRCNGSLLEVCNSSRQWQTQQVCAQTCDTSTTQCSTDTTCTPASRRCNDQQIQVCNSTGTAWLTVETCAVACNAGLCTGACTPGARRCNGNAPEECNGGGTAWVQENACATFCYKGSCAEPPLVIDANANATLDGEHVYDGDVVIRNTSTVKVASGRLVIRARSVTIDASSSITVDPHPTGDPRGKGADGPGSTSCYASYCTAYGNAGGGGGGNAAAGGQAGGTFSCYNYGTYYCSVTRAGGPQYAIADDEAALGSAGGACSPNSGGKGGGLLAIYAETITINGTLTANGQGGSGCAGGGSGGSIVLRAYDSLTFGGSASVLPGVGGTGAGAGASGVVKLLWGNSHSITGTLPASSYVKADYMPPNDLSSATHPDPTRWYNDGFTAFEVAWSNPFTQSGGYYYKLNTTYGFVPIPSNATYQTPESLLYLPAALAAGANYLHVAAVGPSFDYSEIESRYLVQINSTLSTIASSSHPTQDTWYDNFNPYLTWNVPHANADTTAFYWVLDRYHDTIPTKSDARIPMNLADPDSSKRILLPVSQGGIWFFHLINEDTMGYLTKQASLYRLQVGTNPGQGSVSGSVTDSATSAFLNGVTISLNRGVQTASTNSGGGYAFPNTVFAQDYEIRASKAGYETMVKSVTVTASQTSTVNFALVPSP